MEEAVKKRDLDGLKAAISASKVEQKETPAERRLILDNIFRCQLGNTTSDSQKTDKELINTVKFAVNAAIQELCAKTTPLVMLSDILDTIPINRCEGIFSFVEDMIPTWNTHFEASRTHLLRLCNDLLRRLSRTVDTQFCGRILVFLARCLPLTEKSGLNITSQFNVDNLTRFDQEGEGGGAGGPAPVSVSVTASEEMEEGEMKELEPTSTSTASSVPVDHALYCKFWQLQNFFSQPQSCYDKFKWKQFTHLLQLQLNDGMFRRYVLVQFLILFQYLTAEVKFKEKKNQLSEEQRKWVDEMTEKAYALLGETYPRGAQFAKSIKHILEREERWNEWKNGACEDFTKRAEKEKMARYKRAQRGKFSKDKLDLGNKELTALWNLNPDNFAACRGADREFVPKVEDFLEEPFEQADPDNQVNEEYKLVSNENFQWRALRLLSRSSSHFWSSTSPNVVTNMGKHLEGLIKKAAMDFPKFQEIVKQKEEEKKKAGEIVPEPEEEKKPEEADEENIAVQPEAGAMDDEDMKTVEPIVSEAQIEELSSLIGSDWAKLATHMGLTDEELALYKKKNKAEDVCTALLNQWLDQEGAGGTTRKLRNLLLEAELFNEDVSAVLQKTESEESADETIEKSLDEKARELLGFV